MSQGFCAYDEEGIHRSEQVVNKTDINNHIPWRSAGDSFASTTAKESQDSLY